MVRSRRQKFPSSLTRRSLHRILPNLTTMAALCFGMSAIRFSLAEKWELCVTLIIMAGIFDGMDGRLARILGSESRLGAQLDSLSDFISFGVAPAFVLYAFSLRQMGDIGWIVSLIFAVCMALRLARFHVQAETSSPFASLRALFFVGVPAPAAAVLSLSPLIFWLHQKHVTAVSPLVTAVTTLLVAGLMISRIPTYALKKVKVSQNILVPLLITAVILVTGLISMPWKTLLIVNGLYVLSIPLSVLRYRKMKKSMLGAQPS